MLTFTNQAALSYRNRVRYSNLTTGQIADALTVSKSALSGTYEADGDVTYVVRLDNNGAAPLTDLSLTDDLGGYAFDQTSVYPLSYRADSLHYYVNGVEQPAPTVTPGAPLTVSGVSVTRPSSPSETTAGYDMVVLYNVRKYSVSDIK